MKENTSNLSYHMFNKITGDSVKVLQELDIPINKDRYLEFTGYLRHDDMEFVCIADLQGSWLIPKNAIVNFEQISNENEKEKSTQGEFVKIKVTDGAIIHEIRPWKVTTDGGELGDEKFKKSVESILTLQGELPIGKNTIEGEEKLRNLERAFTRRIGQKLGENPLDVTTLKGPSKTIVIVNGMCDADCGF
jgi:hypothetical protein